MTCFGPSFLSEGTPVKLPNGRFQVGLVSHSFSEGWMSVIQDLWVRDSLKKGEFLFQNTAHICLNFFFIHLLF